MDEVDEDRHLWHFEPTIVRYHYFHNKPGFELPVDVHQEWTAMIVEKGQFEYRIGSLQGTAGNGTLVLCSPDTPFHRRTEHPITFHFVVFHWLDFSGEPIPPHLYPKQAKWTYRHTSRLQSTLALLQAPLPSPADLQNKWKNHLLHELLRLQWMEQYLPADTSSYAAQDPMMEKAKKTLRQIFDHPGKVQELAASFNISPVQFSRRFQRAFGMNPSDYTNQLRLEKACQLLTHTTLTIEEIAGRCGFSNGFYLSRVFVKKMGMPPSRWRMTYRV